LIYFCIGELYTRLATNNKLLLIIFFIFLYRSYNNKDSLSVCVWFCFSGECEVFGKRLRADAIGRYMFVGKLFDFVLGARWMVYSKLDGRFQSRRTGMLWHWYEWQYPVNVEWLDVGFANYFANRHIRYYMDNKLFMDESLDSIDVIIPKLKNNTNGYRHTMGRRYARYCLYLCSFLWLHNK